MGKKIVIQRKGQTMKEGTIVNWLKKDGEYVEANEPIYELEYDKAACEVKAPVAGILCIYEKEGTTLPVGTQVGEILAEGEEPNRKSPEVKEVQNKMEWKDDSKRVRATPLARKIAKLNHVSLDAVSPRDGKEKITAADIERYLGDKKNNSELPEERKVPLSSLRKAIARNMTENGTKIPTVTYSMEIDFSECLNMRVMINEELEGKNEKISINDVILKGVATALRQHPDMNTSLKGDEIIYHTGIHIGIAVAVPGGLVVPVLRDADKKTLNEVSKEAAELIKKANQKTLTEEEMSGGTFTVTNLGNKGIDKFTPIINENQAGILGVGSVCDKPVVVNGKVEIRSMITLNLTTDHRLIDGAPAADFLGYLKHLIEKPVLMFV